MFSFRWNTCWEKSSKKKIKNVPRERKGIGITYPWSWFSGECVWYLCGVVFFRSEKRKRKKGRKKDHPSPFRPLSFFMRVRPDICWSRRKLSNPALPSGIIPSRPLEWEKKNFSIFFSYRLHAWKFSNLRPCARASQLGFILQLKILLRLSSDSDFFPFHFDIHSWFPLLYPEGKKKNSNHCIVQKTIQRFRINVKE